MKIALIGATGFVGAATLNELLSRGHEVTAVVRSAGRMEPAANVTQIVADAYDAESVAEAVAGTDAVVSAFNPGWHDPDLYDKFVRGAASIQRGVELSGIKRFLVVGGAGSLYVAPGVQLVDTPEFTSQVPEYVVPGARGARDAMAAIAADNCTLDWTFVSPPAFLEDGERTGNYRLGTDTLLMDGEKPAGISVADLAIAIVDELEQPRHVRSRFTAARGL
ncbi:NAD(P)-dependent oxidoreductase [Modicisalibacter radicis]|uniref:NAD(P)-dependent oxidoreductase n=1 Tax=Halomonas sp. EAR18 TaxID=2518972 RepID=UPI00109CCA7A|nr:NAD(P)H-binding protein [Halomonas sp. EAR18]